MFTQTSNISVQLDGHQELVLQLQREDLGSCPLGTVGNLQVNVEQGGTAPARRAGVRLSEIRRSLAGRGVNLNACFTRESPQARAQRDALAAARAEVRANSRLIGNLLGSLTAPAAGLRNHDRIAQALIALNVPAEGGLYSLKGAEYCLATYLDELKKSDRDALSHGVLGNKEACTAVLDRISTRTDDALRLRAHLVLTNIAEVLDQCVLQYAVHEPLSHFVNLLDARPVNGRKLCEQLMMISFDNTVLECYFSSLPADEFKKMVLALLCGSPDKVRAALFNRDVNMRDPAYTKWNALAKLDKVRLALSNVLYERVKPVMDTVDFILALVFRTQWNQRDACGGLRYLSGEVSELLAVYGVLPRLASERVRERVNQSMDLLRDRQNNPVGPLNVHSLRKLDDGMRADLGGAAQVLRSFGLKLESEMY